jgi:hypothetical protein
MDRQSNSAISTRDDAATIPAYEVSDCAPAGVSTHATHVEDCECNPTACPVRSAS